MHGKGVLLQLELKILIRLRSVFVPSLYLQSQFFIGTPNVIQFNCIFNKGCPNGSSFEPHMEMAAAGIKEGRQPRYQATCLLGILMLFSASRLSGKMEVIVFLFQNAYTTIYLLE